MLWAACCLGYFRFMRAGEFIHVAVNCRAPAPILVLDIAVDSHSSSSMVRVFLRRAKADPFGKGISIYLGRTNSPFCPVAAVLHYLVSATQARAPSLFIKVAPPLTRDQFVKGVKAALSAAGIAHQNYSGHSFCIGAATAAATAGIPAYTIKMLGCWSPEAYNLYIHTPREALAAISWQIAF